MTTSDNTGTTTSANISGIARTPGLGLPKKRSAARTAPPAPATPAKTPDQLARETRIREVIAARVAYVAAPYKGR